MDFQNILDKHHENTGGLCRHYLTIYSLVLGVEAKNVFEFGAGFSSLVILSALEKTGGILTSCDIRPIEQTGISAESANLYQGRWHFLNVRSSEAVKQADDQSFDVVLHDGSHDAETVRHDLKTIVTRVKKNGLILVHDTEHPSHDYGLKHEIARVLRWLPHERMTLPFGYGLTVIRVKKDFGLGSVCLSWKKADASENGRQRNKAAMD